jgi:hypothetical protein
MDAEPKTGTLSEFHHPLHPHAGLKLTSGWSTLYSMQTRHPPELEMNLAGEFVSPPKPPVSSRIMVSAIVVAIIAGALSFAALALWIALTILPFAIAAVAVAWGMLRYRMWRAQRGASQQVWRR